MMKIDGLEKSDSMIEKVKEKIKDLSKDNKKLLTYCVIGVFVLITIIGGSYAILSLTLTGRKELEIVAGTLAVRYADGNIVSLENMYPVSDKEGMQNTSSGFSVENTGELRVKYDVSLELGKSKDELDAKYVRYAVREKGGEWSSPASLKDGLVLIKDIEIDPKEKREYELKLWVDRNTGNDAQEKTFKGKIVVSAVQINASTLDATAPVIILAGSTSVNVPQGSRYSDLGVESVRDNKDTLDKSNVVVSYEYYDGSETKEVESIDTSKLGVYYAYYKIKDKSQNEGAAVRSINVYKKDTTPPVITLNGNAIVEIDVDGEYTELGATATDDIEGDITSRVVTVGTVNTKRKGLYYIKYLITDQEGNTASVVRVVNVGHVPYEFILDIETKPTDKIDLPGVTDKENVTYKSEDETIATVDPDGNVTAKDVGETKVIITDEDGEEKEVIIKVEKTITPEYNPEGPGVIRIENTDNKCAISKKGGTCTVVAPDIIVEEGYTVVGWNEDPTAKDGIPPGGALPIGEGKTYYPITYKNGEVYRVYFNANGNTIGETEKSCNTGNIYRGEEGSASCTITTPEITAPAATPTVLGYNQSASGTTKEIGSGESLVLDASNNGRVYYAITSRLAVSYIATFNKNGATSQTDASGTASTAATVTRSCTIPATYNGTAQTATTCNVTSPVIVASSNTPTITGYSTAATRYANDWSANSVKAISSNVTYYAQTTKAAVTRTATYSKGSGVSAIGANSGSCTIAATYNGTAQGTSCNVSLPSITSLAGYNTGFWSTSNTATSGSAAGSSVGLTSNVTYYARALDTTKPIWKIGSGSSSGSVSSSSQVKIVIQGTDTSGGVTSTLSAANITVKVGSTTVTPTTKTLSAASNITNGKQYTLTLSGFNTGGALSITIAANTLKDGSNNQNIATTITPGVTIVMPLSDIWNSTNLGDGGYTSGDFIRGTNPNNYIRYSGVLWRVYKLESSNYKLIAANPTSRVSDLGGGSWDASIGVTYCYPLLCNSTVGKDLNGNFLQNLYEYQKFLYLNNSWDTGGAGETSCPIGLINASEYEQINSWLPAVGWTTTTCYESSFYHGQKIGIGSSRIQCIAGTSEDYAVHPVIVLKNDITIASGTGTRVDPYRLVGDNS